MGMIGSVKHDVSSPILGRRTNVVVLSRIGFLVRQSASQKQAVEMCITGSYICKI